MTAAVILRMHQRDTRRAHGKECVCVCVSAVFVLHPGTYSSDDAAPAGCQSNVPHIAHPVGCRSTYCVNDVTYMASCRRKSAEQMAAPIYDH